MTNQPIDHPMPQIQSAAPNSPSERRAGMTMKSTHQRTAIIFAMLLSVLFAKAVNGQKPARDSQQTVPTEQTSGVAAIDLKGDPPRFSSDIRPILATHCLPCHGPDAGTREGGFRLDDPTSATAEADSGARPIVPGDVEHSELVRRILANDESERMPPTDFDKPLSDAQRDLLIRWIASGAVYEQHWAFEPIGNPEVPLDASDAWSRNEIDRFVLSGLRSRGLHPQTEADRRTLIRRLSLDLLGLPPSPTEIEAFLNDGRPDAYERLVDRMLKSPHRGERLAVDWLDAARYADTNGYQNDFGREMWPWRDWVIRAFNANQPYDQFTVEQLAGDLLPNPTREQLIATGFNRNHRSVTEGGSIDEEWRVENVVDRVETTATVWLGLTMGCARCHDHKYDPISQREFYQSYAYFNSMDEKGVHLEKRGNVPPMIRVPTDEQRAQAKELDSKIAEATDRLQQIEATLPDQQQAWQRQWSTIDDIAAPDDHRLKIAGPENSSPEKVRQSLSGEPAAARLADSVVGPALMFDRDTNLEWTVDDDLQLGREQPFTIAVWVYPKTDGAIISRMDQANAYRGFDLLITGDFQLNVHLIHNWPDNAIKITTVGRLEREHWNHVTVTYDGSSQAAGLKVWFDGNPTEVTINNDHLDGSTETDHPLWLGYRGYTPRFSGQIADLRVYLRQLIPTERRAIQMQAVQSAARRERPDQQQAEFLARQFRTTEATDWIAAKRRLDRLRQDKTALESRYPTTMIMKELEVPRMTWVLIRGQYNNPDTDQPVSPGIPAFLPQPPADAPPNRLGLARWIVDPANPLTARVAVNRIWQQFFGQGLVATPENFGIQSDPPVHPELLDWLATRFIESRWDIRELQRLIVTSATYRQSSTVPESVWNLDPKNQWLGRGARFRLNAETIRDQALAISGLMQRSIGGPSIKPYQPPGLWQELAGGASQGAYQQDTGPEQFRRSLYIYRKRTVPHPALTTFDAGSREVCQVNRPRTNTPLQALAALNDPTYVQAAIRLADQIAVQHADDESAIATIFQSVTCRPPRPEELALLKRSVARYRSTFQDHPDQAKAWISNRFDDGPVACEDPARLAALSVATGVILNLDETLTRE